MKEPMSDPVDTAKAARLNYVNDSQPGYIRKRSGKKFIYWNGNSKLKNRNELKRINELVIPPAWENVWVCKLNNGHLQATGIDKMGRKQYKYHFIWNRFRSQSKFYRLYEFGKNLPGIRLEIKKNLSLSGFKKEKILAALISLLDKTNIRVGNSYYEKLYGSFGLTTLKNSHVKLNGPNIRFSFTGKKGIKHNISLQSKKLSGIIKRCKEIPGKELFEYIDDDGTIHKIDSGMINNYIQDITGFDFTAKDFRTWAGSVKAISSLKEINQNEFQGDNKKNLQTMFEQVATELGNTKAVCKKYYVHPLITELYEKNELNKYILKLNSSNSQNGKTGLSADEKILMKILKFKK